MSAKATLVVFIFTMVVLMDRSRSGSSVALLSNAVSTGQLASVNLAVVGADSTSGTVPLRYSMNVPAKELSVIVSESDTAISDHGIDRSDCALILPDGNLHVERRIQRLPNQPTTRVFTSKLNKAQFEELENILANRKVRNLPQFTPPTTPMNVQWFHYFNVEITQDQQSKRIGYFKWHGQVPAGASPASMPDAVKKAWQISETELQPLVQWFHKIQSSKLESSTAAPTQCNESSRH